MVQAQNGILKQTKDGKQRASGLIIGKTGMYRYATIPIGLGEKLIIGRDAVVSHLVLDTDAEKVSRKHCQVEFKGFKNGYTVTDYSSNGTYTDDGKRLEKEVPTSIPSGTSICLGSGLNSFILAALPEDQ